ncbi:MAG TPA: glycosyltransferase [Terriglobia bacterium]|nr:glycosyltransferase [Terriglobia bacterium]
MRFLILDTGYPKFLSWLYDRNPGLEKKSYETQAAARMETLFGQAAFYADSLRKLGHQAWDIEANNEFMQKAWAREHGLPVSRGRRWEARLRKGFVPWLSAVNDQTWLYEILAAQIKYYKPHVLVNYAMLLRSAFFRELKPYVRLLVGNHGAPLPGGNDFGLAPYDLVLSVVDNLVDYFRNHGKKSELLRLGFEPAVLERLSNPRPDVPVSFVGNLYSCHTSRMRWLEFVAQNVPVRVFTASADGIPNESPMLRYREDAVWGRQMYETLKRSELTLNHHVDIAEDYAGNARLFEATGVGTLLVTDWKKNLHEMFEPGKEVVAYRTPEECVEMIRHYLEHEDERRAIARAGQQRTLRDHTCRHRMEELVTIVERYLRPATSGVGIASALQT